MILHTHAANDVRTATHGAKAEEGACLSAPPGARSVRDHPEPPKPHDHPEPPKLHSPTDHQCPAARLDELDCDTLFDHVSLEEAADTPHFPAVGVRLLSRHTRRGMPHGGQASRPGLAGLLGRSDVAQPASASLVIHFHGGGFVASTSQTHLAYLTTWATVLDVPILCVDYSLAPEHPYPRLAWQDGGGGGGQIWAGRLECTYVSM